MKRILISLGVVIVVSAVTAWFFQSFNLSFARTFAFATVLQFIGFYFYFDTVTARRILKYQEQEVKKLDELGKQGTVVKCSYCQASNFVPLRFDLDNELKCSKCNKISAVFINVESTQKTIPIATNSSVIAQSIFQELANSSTLLATASARLPVSQNE